MVSFSAAGRAAGLLFPESMARILAMVREGICSHRHHCHNPIHPPHPLHTSVGSRNECCQAARPCAITNLIR